MEGVSVLLLAITAGSVAAMLAMAGAVRSIGRDRREARLALTDSHARLDQAMREMRAATAELDSFAYSVAHDLRAPLRAIDGFSRALIEDFTDKLEPEPARLLGIVRRNSLRMGVLIDDLLGYSRLSRQPLAKRRLEPAAIVRRILADGDAKWANRAVGIELGALPACAADPTLLPRLYANLIDNAMKFTAKTAKPRVEIGSHACDGAIVYFVADNGVGFDMAHAGKLFGVFQRLHRFEDYDGTGIGLAVAQRIVHRHGGEIWAKAAPGAGASFFFTLGGERAMTAVEIMLVEDNPDDVELTVRALRKNHFTNPIRVLRDGAEALDYLFGSGTDGRPNMAAVPVVMLLDLKLPKVNGTEVLQRVKSDPRTRTIPVVVLTSSREDRDLAETYELGANSYIVKPVDFDQFNRAVNQIGMYWLLINQHPGG